MKFASILWILILFGNFCNSQEKTSKKVFEDISLVNKIEFFDHKFDQPKFSCGFLLKYEGYSGGYSQTFNKGHKTG